MLRRLPTKFSNEAQERQSLALDQALRLHWRGPLHWWHLTLPDGSLVGRICLPLEVSPRPVLHHCGFANMHRVRPVGMLCPTSGASHAHEVVPQLAMGSLLALARPGSRPVLCSGDRVAINGVDALLEWRYHARSLLCESCWPRYLVWSDHRRCARPTYW